MSYRRKIRTEISKDRWTPAIERRYVAALERVAERAEALCSPEPEGCLCLVPTLAEAIERLERCLDAVPLKESKW